MHYSEVQILIMDALLELMKTEEFRKITITHLTQEAQVARKTFYLNYSNKEDVLRHKIKSMAKSFEHNFVDHDSIIEERLALEFFNYFEIHAEFILLLEKNGLFQILIDEFEQFIQTLALTNRIQGTLESHTINNTILKYAIHYNAAGLYMLLKKWISYGMKESKEQMVDIYRMIKNIY